MMVSGRFRTRLRRFLFRQDGAASALGVSVTGLLLLVVGASVDIASLYRYRAQLQITADIAAQSGVVALTWGDDVEGARDAARSMVEKNMPESIHGQLLSDPATELQVLHYDIASGELGQPGEDAPANAVVVRLQRNAASGNPLPSVMKGMANPWSLSATSVAVVVPTQRCGNAEGIVAHGAIALGMRPSLAPGFCLHSQSTITLPAGTQTTEPLRISLPDPSGCEGECAPAAAADSDLRPMAMNLLMPKTGDHVAYLVEGFLDRDMDLLEEAAFFATRPLDGDPEAFREVGLSAKTLRKGDVVRMTALQFSQMRERPSGLVYDVRCNTVENDPRPVWERTLTLIGDGFNPTLRDLVLVTDCAIEMDDVVRIEGALILMTGPEEARIEALPGATLGDPRGTCDPSRRVRLMSLGDMALPGALALSNVSAVAGGSIRLESDPDQWITSHEGLVLHAGADVIADSVHSFAQCPDEVTSDPLMPQMLVIAHAMPDLKDVLPPLSKPRPKTDMPGQEVKGASGKTEGRMKMDGEVEPGS